MRPSFSTNQQQSRELARQIVGGAVDAGRNGTVGRVDCDAPEIAQSEIERVRVRQRRVMEIVAIFVEVGPEVVVVCSAEMSEEFSAGFGDIDPAARFVVTETFARGTVVGAEKSVGDDWCAVSMERVDVSSHRATIFVAGITSNAIEFRCESPGAESLQVVENNGPRDLTGGSQPQRKKAVVVDGRYPFAAIQQCDNLAEVAGKRALPAEGVDFVAKGRCGQFAEIPDNFDAVISERWRERGHRRKRCDVVTTIQWRERNEDQLRFRRDGKSLRGGDSPRVQPAQITGVTVSGDGWSGRRVVLPE